MEDEIRRADGQVVVWQHRCSDGVGGCTAISDTVISAIVKVAQDDRYSDAALGGIVRSHLCRVDE